MMVEVSWTLLFTFAYIFSEHFVVEDSVKQGNEETTVKVCSPS